MLVATPIGNLGDLSPRAVETLAGADLVCCEDTRRTGRLLASVGVAVSELRRVDAHTEAAGSVAVCDLLATGATVAVVSDAGMPSLSDPGQRLVAAAIAAGHAVTVVPGPSAAVAAVVASGLSTTRWVFEGFLPRKGKTRAARLASLASEQRSIVLYESPVRLAATLNDLSSVCGPDRRAVVARELTKLHEEIVRGTLAELCRWSQNKVRGEVVLVIEGAPETAPVADDELESALLASLRSGTGRRDAVAEVAAAYNVARRRVYGLALNLND